MARQRRIQVPGGFHHITARGNNRDPLFLDDGDRRTLLRVLGEAAAHHRCSVHAFCLMTNHIHLVVEDERAELSKCLQKVNGRYAQRFNRRHNRTGHVFEGRFWNSLLDTDSYLTTAIEYVHRNPLDAGMVDDLATYRWSSYPVYLGHRRRPRFLSTGTVMASYGGDVHLLRSRTEQVVREPGKDEALSARRPAPVLGSERFIQRMTAESERIAKSSDSKGHTYLDNRLSLTEVAKITANLFDLPVEALRRSVRGQPNRPRSIAIHLAHVDLGWSFDAIGDFFDISGSAASMTSKRLQGLLGTDAEVDAALPRVRSRLAAAAQEQVGV